MKKVIVILVILSILTAGVFFGTQYVLEMLPTKERASLQEVFPYYEQGKISVVMREQNIDMVNNPKVHKGMIYLPVDLINTYIDPYYYWDAKEGTLTYTTKNQVIRMKNEELTYFVNSAPLELQMPIMTFESDMAYVPMNIIEGFSQISYSFNEGQGILVLDIGDKQYGESVVMKKTTEVRVKPDIKGKIAEDLQPDSKVRVYKSKNQEDWVWVRTESGILGYVKRQALGTIREILPATQPVETQATEPPNLDIEGKINIAWHHVTNVYANDNLGAVISGANGLDVISPTWFELKDSEGNISNIASKAYVDYAKSKGLQVWALFSNAFDPKKTHDVLSSTEKREKVIKQILAMVSIYDLDGINIDFESVAKEDGPYYVQFIREITPYLKEQGVVVSVDMYVPSAWTAHYNRAELGKVIDYLIIMAYDEHWSTSPKSGSVASIGFVDRGITATLEEVPKEKVILGLPYYTRRWKEEKVDGEIKVSSKAYSMNRAKKILADKGVEIEWLEEVGQYYGDYIEDNVTYKIWLEEERSIEEKLKLMEKYQLAGAAGWKIGLEKPEIWDLLKNYLRKE